MLDIIQTKYGNTATGLLPAEFVTYECTRLQHVLRAAHVADQQRRRLRDRDGRCEQRNLRRRTTRRSTSAAMSTSQTFVPNDTATLAGLATPVGNLRFKLFKTTAPVTTAQTATGSRQRAISP